MDYKKAYYSLIERLKEAKEDADVCDERYCCVIDGLIREPEESERIRKAISQCVEDMRGQFEKLYSVHHKDAIAWLEKKGKQKEDARWELLEKLLEADSIYQMAMNDAMVAEAKSKAISAISKLSIFDLLVVEKQDEQKPYGQRQVCGDCQFNYAGKCKGSCAMKRGEQKPQGKTALEAIHEKNPDNANKVERKFKVGDYIVNDYCKGKVIELTTDAYLLDTGQGIPFSYEHNAHLWTLADAKDGDIFAFDNETIVIFKELYNATTFHSYCYIEDGVFNAGDDEAPDWWEGKNFYPATKEQRSILFQKVHEAGYEWNDKRKKLRKINQKE